MSCAPGRDRSARDDEAASMSSTLSKTLSALEEKTLTLNQAMDAARLAQAQVEQVHCYAHLLVKFVCAPLIHALRLSVQACGNGASRGSVSTYF